VLKQSLYDNKEIQLQIVQRVSISPYVLYQLGKDSVWPVDKNCKLQFLRKPENSAYPWGDLEHRVNLLSSLITDGILVTWTKKHFLWPGSSIDM